MVVSINPEPNKKIFQSLLDNTLFTLDSESKRNQVGYLNLLGNKLEDVVADIMTDKAKGTPFENSIELISGQRFPDIIANNFYGVEIKTTKQNHWTTTGNSVMEGTRVPGIERIFMLFGKMVSPIEFKCRPYEDCLADVVVTHSPRYLINMDLPRGKTIFDKLNIPYDSLRRKQNPVKPIIDYYRQFLKPGEELWWLEQEDAKPKELIIHLWNNLSLDSRKEFMLNAMVLFPEIFSHHIDKFNRVAVWLVNMQGVVCPNIRDVFTAGGQGQIIWKKKIYFGVPKVIIKLMDSLVEVKDIINNTDNETLMEHWGVKFSDKVSKWIDLVSENTNHMNLGFNLKKYLIEHLLIKK